MEWLAKSLNTFVSIDLLTHRWFMKLFTDLPLQINEACYTDATNILIEALMLYLLIASALANTPPGATIENALLQTSLHSFSGITDFISHFFHLTYL